MASKGRSPEEWITFLLTAMDDYTDGKTNWQQFAVDTGTYKSAKFAKQAYVNLREKYGKLPGAGAAASVPATPKGTKKRVAQDDLAEEENEKPKRNRKAKTPKREQPKMEIKDEDDVKEVNGDATVVVKDDDEED